MMNTPLAKSARIAVLAAVLGASGGSALALPVSLQGTFSGSRSDTLNISLRDDLLTDFEGADLLVTFASSTLTFSAITAGGLLGTAFVAANDTVAGEVTVNVIPNAPVTGGPGDVVTLSFLIRNDAPFGSTDLTFATLDNTVYDIPGLTQSITVSPLAAAAPLPGTAALLLAGLVPLLGLARRGRRTG